MAKSKGAKNTTGRGVAVEKRQANTSTNTALSDPSTGIPKIWPKANITPGNMRVQAVNAPIVLLFHGLLSFINFGPKRCDVGVHNQDPDHDFVVYVLNDSFKVLQAIPVRDLKSTDPFTFTADKVDAPVSGADGTVGFFQDQDIFRRDMASDHECDFRWLLDFEGPEFYNSALQLKPETLKPTLRVYNGLFHTAQLTKSTFKRHSPEGELSLGPIAFLIAANIYLAAGGTATLRIGKQVINFTKETGKRIIWFSNSCLCDKCEFDPKSPRKEGRNDFHMYYRTFEIPSARREFELIADKIVPSPCPTIPNLFSSVEGLKSNTQLMSILKRFSTDPAPCGGGGHSGGGTG
jgi:hypothetical protein